MQGVKGTLKNFVTVCDKCEKFFTTKQQPEVNSLELSNQRGSSTFNEYCGTEFHGLYVDYLIHFKFDFKTCKHVDQ